MGRIKAHCDTSTPTSSYPWTVSVAIGPNAPNYLCHAKDRKSFRNQEYLRIRNGKLQSIECDFGAQSSFSCAVSTGQK